METKTIAQGMVSPDEIEQLVLKYLEEKYPGKEVDVNAELDERYDSYGDYKYTVFEGYSYSVEE